MDLCPKLRNGMEGSVSIFQLNNILLLLLIVRYFFIISGCFWISALFSLLFRLRCFAFLFPSPPAVPHLHWNHTGPCSRCCRWEPGLPHHSGFSKLKVLHRLVSERGHVRTTHRTTLSSNQSSNKTVDADIPRSNLQHVLRIQARKRTLRYRFIPP